ncbi:MAG: PilZ domain-containing protein [Candidatus Omnitrophica bacterium]|nr:PilZ domain-containing protein [Candidatus Omnitrophota bacterium]
MAVMPEVQLERRGALRLPWVKRVEVNRQGAVPVAVDSVNLSEAGLCVRLRETLEISSAVTLRLFAEARKPPVTCAGRVAWVVQRLDLRSRPPFLYDVGVEFVNPPGPVRRLAVRLGTSSPASSRAARAPSSSRGVESLMIRGRCYLPRLQKEGSRQGAWHLIVWVDGVPCFSRRYASEREGVAGWKQFKRAASPLAGRKVGT